MSPTIPPTSRTPCGAAGGTSRPRPRAVLPIVALCDPPRVASHAPAAHEAAAGSPGTDGSRRDLTEDGLPALLTVFYVRVGHDSSLAPYFAQLDLAAHIPRIADFWATIVFHADRYRGNAFRPHLDMPGLTAAHFARWVTEFEATVDALHVGPRADRMKMMAHRIAYSMQLRLGVTPSAPLVPLP